MAPWGLALLRRKAAPGPGQFRRRRDQAIPSARPHDRGRLRLRHPPVRRQLRRAQGYPGLAPGRPVWEVRRSRRQATRRCSTATTSPGPPSVSGAWMTSLRDQQKLDGEIAPWSSNVCNCSKAPTASRRCCRPTTPAPCSTSSGHGLHGMLSDVTYPSLSGTSVFTDLRRSALAALRALAGAAAGAAAVRKTLPDRRAAAGRPAQALPRRAQIQPRALPPWSSSTRP